ncbi:hypothetical protein P3L10_018943 [Capsicum annuum]
MSDRGDKGKEKVVLTKTKKKNQPPSYRRPTGIHISEGRFADATARPLYSRSSQQSVPTSMHVGTLHGSTPTYYSPITVLPPSQYYWTIAGPSGILPSLVPSCNSHAALHNDFARSIGLLDLQLGGTPSDALDPPTLVHPPSLTPQPGDRDDLRGAILLHMRQGLGRMLELDKL